MNLNANPLIPIETVPLLLHHPLSGTVNTIFCTNTTKRISPIPLQLGNSPYGGPTLASPFPPPTLLVGLTTVLPSSGDCRLSDFAACPLLIASSPSVVAAVPTLVVPASMLCTGDLTLESASMLSASGRQSRRSSSASFRIWRACAP